MLSRIRHPRGHARVVFRFGVAYTNRAEETDPVRVTTAFKRLMDLSGVTVTEVVFEAARVVVTVKMRSAKLRCPECGFTTRSRYDARPVVSTWRHLDLGPWRLEVRASLRRLVCPIHGVRTQGVPFARAGSRFTRDFEDLIGWLATTMDKTALCRLVRIDWDTVGRIIERVMATGLDKRRLDNLFVAGVDEVSWRKGHSYVTLVSNHATGKFVWGKEGKDTDTLDCFFDELGPERSAAITAMSMDMGPAYESSAKKEGHAVNAVICYDPFMSCSRSRPPSRRSAGRSGRTCESCPTRMPPAASKVPGGRCSRTPPT